MITVTIAGTDRTKLVVLGSLTISNVLTSQVDTADFRIRKFGDRTFVPAVGNVVNITVGGTLIFAGRISQLDEDYDKIDHVDYAVSCTDYTKDLDRRMVAEVYQDTTVEAIIADIATNYLDAGFSTAGVNCSTTIDYMAFNYEYPSACLKKLADLTGFDWYVDPNKVIYFFATAGNAAPFALSDDGGKYIYDSLQLRRDAKPVRNTVFMIGGEYLGNTITAAYEAQLNQTHFLLPYRLSDLKVMVTGTQQTLGIDNIDSAASYNALYNFSEKLVKMRADKISTAAQVRISGRPYLPVRVKVRDNASISLFSAAEASSGVYEFKVVDKSIVTKEAARLRANAELLAYAYTLVEGSFETHTDGLRAGQYITVQSTARGINTQYVINRVEATPYDQGATMIYRVSLVSTKTFDYIQFLQSLLENQQQAIIVGASEVIDVVESEDESMTMTAAQITQPLNYAITFVMGEYIPTISYDGADKKRTFVLDGSTLG